MAKINENYLKLQAGYLFPEIGRRVSAFLEKHPSASVIRLGIGDVTEALYDSVSDAILEGVHEMKNRSSFKGYGPEQGYPFLREAIAAKYRDQGVRIDPSEIFVSDGSKCDSANIQEIFSQDAKIAVTDPVYPVYVDSNVMAGRSGTADSRGCYEGFSYLPCTAENNFNPGFPETPADLIYLCSPNNPTGTVMTREILKSWVDYANENASIILFDAAYEAFIRDEGLPRSIFEIEGSRKCAIEFRSFSKDAGFTGLRCAYTVIPDELQAETQDGKPASVQKLWARRHSTKFNGASYLIQKGAAAALSPKGSEESKKRVRFYMENADLVKETLQGLGFSVYGGSNAPYIWFKTRGNQRSFDFFDELLLKAEIVGTPGSGFGPSGEGYFRLSAFNSRENIKEAMARMKKNYS